MMDAGNRLNDTARIDITVENDGVYLTINNPPGQPKVSNVEVLGLIDAYGVEAVDYIQLDEALKEAGRHIKIKISDNKKIIQTDETATVEISKDNMEAFISFSPPVNKGKKLTQEQIMALIEAAGIVGVDADLVKALVFNKRYTKQYVIAKGTPPIAGTDGFLQYHFDNSSLRPKPKIMEDGSVNFRQLGLFRLCNRGDVLVTSVMPQDGVDGKDVHGKPIPFSRGRRPIPLPRGKNTSLSEDGLRLIADVSGLLVIQNMKINISPCLEVKGDVDNSVGDIDFNGMVSIGGSVLAGFTVKAAGNIEVHGVCEAATLISDANIILGDGAKGSDKAVLSAKGDITARFLEGCKVIAGGNVTADSIIKCEVNCEGSVTLTGKNGLLLGGSIVAGVKVTAKTIGSSRGTITQIEVGNKPQELINYKNISAEYTRLSAEYEKVDQAVKMLYTLQKKDQLSEDKKTLLLKMINAKMALRTKMIELQGQMDALLTALSTHNGVVSATRSIQPGVRVSIGNEQMVVQDEIPNCTLRNDGEKIAISPCV